MDKVKQLFVRACKSNDPAVRVMSVYRKFYLSQGTKSSNVVAITGILTGIVDKYCPMTSSELINELGPTRDWLFPNMSYHERAMRVLINKIRYAEASKFAGLTASVQFRKVS